MHHVTTFSLGLLTLVALAASVMAIRLLRQREAQPRHRRLLHALVLLCTAGSAAVFIYQAAVVNRAWNPLSAHVDGLLLIAALLGGTILFLQTRPRLFGLSAFALPVLALILAWGICASAWTYRPFNLETLHPAWRAVHLSGVYLGTLSSAVAAVSGGMFLYVSSRLRRKRDLPAYGNLASLETLETLIIRTAALGFALLTLGLVAGLVLEPEKRLGHGWWHSPKILLATAAWLSYALVMNVRYATSFRGRRAAWLSIAGFALLLATYSVISAMPSSASTERGLESVRHGDVSLNLHEEGRR